MKRALHQLIHTRRESVLTAAIVAVFLVPIWAFRHVPTLDGPTHLYNAVVLRRLLLEDGGPHADFYRVAPTPAPNWTSQLLLLGLVLCVPAAVALKLVYSLLVAGLILSFRYALSALDGRAARAWPLVLPFAYSWYFHTGFLNYCLGIALTFGLYGAYLRWRRRPAWPATGLLAVGMTLLYFTHVVALGAVWAMVALDTAWRLGRGLRLPRWRRTRAGWFGARARFILAALPSAILALLAVRDLGATREASPQGLWPDFDRIWPQRLLPLLKQRFALDSFDAIEQAVGIALTLLLAAVAVAVVHCLVRTRRRRLKARDAPLFVALGMTSLVLVAPWGLGVGMFLPQRLAVFPPLMFGAWLASRGGTRPAGAALRWGGLALGLAMLANTTAHYVLLSPKIDQFVRACAPVEDGDVLLTLIHEPYGYGDAATVDEGTRVMPLVHAAAWVGARRPVHLAHDDQGALEVFPLRYREGRGPIPHLRLFYAEPDMVDPAAWERASGARIDWVLVWDPDGEMATAPDPENPRRTRAPDFLRAHFVPIAHDGNGGATLYRRR